MMAPADGVHQREAPRQQPGAPGSTKKNQKKALLGWLGERWSLVIVQPDTENTNRGWNHTCGWGCWSQHTNTVTCGSGKTCDDIRAQVGDHAVFPCVGTPFTLTVQAW